MQTGCLVLGSAHADELSGRAHSLLQPPAVRGHVSEGAASVAQHESQRLFGPQRGHFTGETLDDLQARRRRPALVRDQAPAELDEDDLLGGLSVGMSLVS